MKEKQLNEIKQLKTQWDHERDKLDLIEEDEERVKEKLIEIYRKNRV